MSSENCLYLDVRIERDRMCPGGDLKRQGSREWQGSTSWRRCRGAGFRGMAGLNRMMRGRVLAERTDAVRGGKRRGSRKAPGPFGGVGSWWCAAAFAMMLGAVRRCRLVVVRGGVRGDARGPRKAPGLFGGVGSWWCAVKSYPLGHMYSVQA